MAMLAEKHWKWSQGCLSCRKTSTNWPTSGHHRADRRRSLMMWLWCTAGDVDGEARQGDQSAVSAAGRRRQTTITQRHSLQQLRQEHRRGRYTCIEASHTGYIALWSFQTSLASCVRSIGRGFGGSERRRRVIGWALFALFVCLHQLHAVLIGLWANLFFRRPEFLRHGLQQVVVGLLEQWAELSCVHSHSTKPRPDVAHLFNLAHRRRYGP